MATSGSINFGLTRDDAITEALELVGALGEGETPTAAQIASVNRTLNMLLKFWQAKQGINLFAIQKVYVFLEKNKNEYSLSSSGDHSTASYVSTTVDGAVSSGASTIDVGSITGISASDYIGVQLADGTMQWTTVNGSPSGSTITLTAALAGDVSDGARVFAYTTKANRPMKIVDAALRNTNNVDIPVNALMRDEYVHLSNKTADGQVVNYYFDPQVGTAKLYVWPETDDVTDILVLWVIRTLDDMDDAADDVAYPQEWYLAIATNLALAISPKYSVPDQQFRKIKLLADMALMEAEMFDVEASFYLQPNLDM